MGATEQEVERYRLAQRVKSSANWFYWIAGLSVVNSIVVHTGSAWSFIAGLGITQLIDAIGAKMGPAANGIAVVFDLLAAGLFVLLGYMAHRHRAAFIVGTVLYAFDGLIFIAAGEVIGLLFHAFVIYCIVLGYVASGKLLKLGPSLAQPIPANAIAPDSTGSS